MAKTSVFDFFKLLDQFISDLEKGKCLQRNGQRMRPGSIRNYRSMRRVLEKFSAEKNFELRIVNLSKSGKQQFESEKRYWKKFHRQLSEYMYKDCNHFDNYVGATFKLLRSFFNYLLKEKGIDLRMVHHNFYVVNEEIPIVSLNPEQLNYLIHDKSFEERLPKRLLAAKDIFVFGCTVGLRVSDLMQLTRSNLETVYGEHYLKVRSKKTQASTRIKLPPYAIDILKKYRKEKHLLPEYHLYTLNKYFREIAEAAGWTHPVQKIRQKRGIQKSLRPAEGITTYRFCDLITTHTMRRTAITTLLNLGMPEHMVRKISGHAPGSKEFFRYVQYSQTFLDQETEKVFSRLSHTPHSEPEKTT